jgi:sucrose-6-phosphate hydrolase SacC (GH32 family)
MSLPRRLSLREDAHGLCLVQQPLPQLASRRTAHQRHGGFPLDDQTRQWELGGAAMQWEIHARFALRGAREFGLRLGDDAQHTLVGYDAQANAVFVDRSRSGLMTGHPDFGGRRRVTIARAPVLELRILVDNCSVEVFIDDGACVITELVFPAARTGSLAVYAAGGGVDTLSLDIWQIA